MVPDELPSVAKRTKQHGFTSTLAQNYAEKLDENYCGLCGTIHDPEACYMVRDSGNLAEYRKTLIEVTNEEPVDHRVSGSAQGPSISLLISCAARSRPGH